VSPNQTPPPLLVADSPQAAAFRAKAISGDTRAACQLGFLYLFGQGVPKMGDEAYHWFTFASQKGDLLRGGRA